MNSHPLSLLDRVQYDDLIGRTVICLEKYGPIISARWNGTDHAFHHYRLEVTLTKEINGWDTFCFQDADDVLSKSYTTEGF